MLRASLLIAAALAALCWPRSGSALEPTTVRVEGVVELNEENESGAGERAFRLALEEAVLEVARELLGSEPLEPPEDAERVREALAPRAPAFVLTYRRHGAPRVRPKEEDPAISELVQEVTATVDAGQIRTVLESLGLLRAPAVRPSLVVHVRGVARAAQSRALFNRFAHQLVGAFEQEGYTVVDPTLYPDASSRGSALELGRLVGADVAIDVAVSWQERPRGAAISGGVAELRARALRTLDGTQVAAARFDAPAYHPERDEALLRALEALEPQVAPNLLLQLERNWRQIVRAGAPLRLRLTNVTSLLQIESVRRTLTDVLGAERAELQELGPGSAELHVKARLSAAALLDRLAAVPFDGFALEPVELRDGDLNLRVSPRELAPEGSETDAADRPEGPAPGGRGRASGRPDREARRSAPRP